MFPGSGVTADISRKETREEFYGKKTEKKNGFSQNEHIRPMHDRQSDIKNHKANHQHYEREESILARGFQ